MLGQQSCAKRLGERGQRVDILRAESMSTAQLGSAWTRPDEKALYFSSYQDKRLASTALNQGAKMMANTRGRWKSQVGWPEMASLMSSQGPKTAPPLPRSHSEKRFLVFKGFILEFKNSSSKKGLRTLSNQKDANQKLPGVSVLKKRGQHAREKGGFQSRLFVTTW